MNSLRKNNELIILNCDKNLGPSVTEKKKYIEYILREHLNDGKDTYLHLSEGYAIKQILELKNKGFSLIFDNYREDIAIDELLYFERSILDPSKEERTQPFYGSPKIHKARQCCTITWITYSIPL